jgi:putative transposase
MTFSCLGRRPLFNNYRIKDVFVAKLVEARQRYDVRLHAFVVMPEHVHLVFNPGEVHWEEMANLVKTQVSKIVLKRWRELGPVGRPLLSSLTVGGRPHFWEPGGGFDRNVRNLKELLKAIRYTHMNPVKRGLVGRPEAWAWSSVGWWLGLDGFAECDYPGDDIERWRAWKGFIPEAARRADAGESARVL